MTEPQTEHSGWEDLAPSVQRFVHRWNPVETPTALVCLVHGLGEHGGRYAPLARVLSAAGYQVVAFDQQGHGRSPGRRGQVQSYVSLLDDIEQMLHWLERRSGGLPTFLFGHSMGGNLVLNYALRKSFLPRAVISSSPMIRAVRTPTGWMEMALRGLLLIAPNHQLKSFIVPERLMSDPAEQRALVDDQLFHNRLTLKLGAGLLDSGRWLTQHADRLSVPTLLTHGTQDYLTSHLASQEFAERAGKVCRLELLEGQLHDTFRDLERQRVLDAIVEFIRQNVTSTDSVPA